MLDLPVAPVKRKLNIPPIVIIRRSYKAYFLNVKKGHYRRADSYYIAILHQLKVHYPIFYALHEDTFVDSVIKKLI